MKQRKVNASKELLAIHTAVFLFGGAGLFAKLIPMSALLLTLGRALFSSLALYMFIHFKKYSLRFHRMRDYFWNIIAGVFLTIHWIFFYLVYSSFYCLYWDDYICYISNVCYGIRTSCF